MLDASRVFAGVSSPHSHTAWPNGVGSALDIVIVDDQTSARTMLRHVIEDIASELSVHDFGDPAVALAWCEANRTDLLLLDYRMPGMDGAALLRHLRQSAPGLKAIAMTGGLSRAEMAQALEAESAEFLLKPFDATVLLETVRRALRA